MRSPLSGPIATLLMFVPLVAIPLLAVFGMPQFSTLSPAAQVEDLKFAPDKDKSSPKALLQESDLIGGVQVTESGAAPQPTDQSTGQSTEATAPRTEAIRTRLPSSLAPQKTAPSAHPRAVPITPTPLPSIGRSRRDGVRSAGRSTRETACRKSRSWLWAKPVPTTAGRRGPTANRPRPTRRTGTRQSIHDPRPGRG